MFHTSTSDKRSEHPRLLELQRRFTSFESAIETFLGDNKELLMYSIDKLKTLHEEAKILWKSFNALSSAVMAQGAALESSILKEQFSHIKLSVKWFVIELREQLNDEVSIFSGITTVKNSEKYEDSVVQDELLTEQLADVELEEKLLNIEMDRVQKEADAAIAAVKLSRKKEKIKKKLSSAGSIAGNLDDDSMFGDIQSVKSARIRNWVKTSHYILPTSSAEIPLPSPLINLHNLTPTTLHYVKSTIAADVRQTPTNLAGGSLSFQLPNYS